ncbi:MAG TPA: putative quinol monooxygenase [Steroidobacteraceae bacterium]|jgi:quinol monooxygenase YgiN
MLLIVGSIRLPAANLTAARPVMARMVQASRAEDGCLEYSYAEDVLEPGLIRITERWRDRSCLERHFASAHIAQWRSSWTELAIGDRQLALYEVSAQQPT